MRACARCFSVYTTDPEHCSFDGEKLATSGDPLSGKVLSGYRLDRLLGVGGTGCVYRGTVLSSGLTCAIKLLFREMAADKSIALRFKREADAVRRIKHPNVVAIIDYGSTPSGPIFLVMEFLEGRTLKDLVESDAPLTPIRACRIAEQLAAGLAEAHRVGFVHRDLKPGNVILSGEHERAKILDFGIVASLKEPESEERLTKTGYIVGTPTYMAPEQMDPKAIAPQVDVYALGVIMYEMISGEPPFSGSLEQILVGKMTRPPEPLRNAGALGDLVLRMLDVDPQKRPASALQVSAEISRLNLLTSDPATIRAEVPDLEGVAQVGFPAPTVQIYDPSLDQVTGPNLRPASSASGWLVDPLRVPNRRTDTVIVAPPQDLLWRATPTGAHPTPPESSSMSEEAGTEMPTKVGDYPSELDTGEDQVAARRDTFDSDDGTTGEGVLPSSSRTDEHRPFGNEPSITREGYALGAQIPHESYDENVTAEGPPPPELLEAAERLAAMMRGPVTQEVPTIDSENGSASTPDSEAYADTRLSLALAQETGAGPTLVFPTAEPMSPGEFMEPTRTVPPPPPSVITPTQRKPRGPWALTVALLMIVVIAAVLAYAFIGMRDTVIIDVPNPPAPKS